MDREMRVAEIARAYTLRPQGKDFPIKSMAPPFISLSLSPHSPWSGDSGVVERADAQEESDALRDLEHQMDTLTMGECWAAPSLSGLPPSLHLPYGLAGLLCALLWLLPPPSPPPGYLCGVDVVAETNFEVTSRAHNYEWRGYGVKLHVQQDSLPADCRQCRVEMRASLSGQYALPVNCELVSGVYWVYCPLKLSKRATLEIQHCSTQREGLSFVRAECTQKQLPYDFQRQEGGEFSEHSFYGSIELSRFSGWGIMKRNSGWGVGWLMSLFQPDSQQYSGQVFYASEAPSKWQVLFAVRHRGNLDLDDTVSVSVCACVLACLHACVSACMCGCVYMHNYM